jgi:hypothetical protein
MGRRQTHSISLAGLWNRTAVILPLLGVGAVVGCSPAYQLSERARPSEDIVQKNNGVSEISKPGTGVPRLTSTYFNLPLYGRQRSPEDILLAALSRYGIDSFSNVDLSINCNDGFAVTTETETTCTLTDSQETCKGDKPFSQENATVKTTTTTRAPTVPPGCVLLLPSSVQAGGGGQGGGGQGGGGQGGGGQGGGGQGGGGQGGGGQGGGGQGMVVIPAAVAAVINAAVDECIFWTYQENNTEIDASTWTTLLGAGIAGIGIAGAVEGWSSAVVGALTGAGGGVALASGLQKSLPTPVQSSVASVIQAGLGYYPFIYAKASSYKQFYNKASSYKQFYNVDESRKVAWLSELWDAAGSGCSVGVLKGHSWRTKWERTPKSSSGH